MANNPPPYSNITGISRAAMKDNAQESLANYDGNARPGELVVNLETDPPLLYVGNNLGQLTLVASGGNGSSSNTDWANIGNINNGNGPSSIAIGFNAGTTPVYGVGTPYIAIGQFSGETNQNSDAIAIGNSAGRVSQEQNTIAIGTLAGNNSQGTSSIAIGIFAGADTQGTESIAIGDNAGSGLQGFASVAIGWQAGMTNQGVQSIAIGPNAGLDTQGTGAVAIGNGAGAINQADYSIAIGAFAGQTNQANNSIVLNATGASLDQTTANTFTVMPVRDGGSAATLLGSGFYGVYYNPTTGEFVYASAP